MMQTVKSFREVCQKSGKSPAIVHTFFPFLDYAYWAVLVYDSGVGNKGRIFIFASRDALQFLADSEHWYADETFRVCLEIFFQLYTIHGQHDGRIFPCVFSL